jgi:hypothetical protein
LFAAAQQAGGECLVENGSRLIRVRTTVSPSHEEIGF